MSPSPSVKYGDPLTDVQKKGNVSHVWCGILAGSDVLEDLDRWPMGGNDSTICGKFTTDGAFQ